jgi:hypothetical protein
LYVDGTRVRGKTFHRPKNETKDINGKRVAGGMKQAYGHLSDNIDIDSNSPKSTLPRIQSLSEKEMKEVA